MGHGICTPPTLSFQSGEYKLGRAGTGLTQDREPSTPPAPKQMTHTHPSSVQINEGDGSAF